MQQKITHLLGNLQRNLSWASVVEAPKCGVATTLSDPNKGTCPWPARLQTRQRQRPHVIAVDGGLEIFSTTSPPRARS